MTIISPRRILLAITVFSAVTFFSILAYAATSVAWVDTGATSISGTTIMHADKLGEDTTAPYGIEWSNAPVGSYTLTAKVSDNGGQEANSIPVSITVSHPSVETVWVEDAFPSHTRRLSGSLVRNLID